MTEVEPVLDFASSGRSGRRNALPDILGSPAGVNPGDLPLKLAELNLKGEAGGVVAPPKLNQTLSSLLLSAQMVLGGPSRPRGRSLQQRPAARRRRRARRDSSARLREEVANMS